MSGWACFLSASGLVPAGEPFGCPAWVPMAWGVTELPTINAALNVTATLLLIAGLVAIKQHREVAHRWLMLGAFGVSAAFLVCYLVHKAQAGSRPFGGSGPVWGVYLAILISHSVLAATVPFLAIASIYFGWRDRRAAHRRVVRWAFPIWLYVSVTGVVIYAMLYHLYPPSGEKTIISTRSPAEARCGTVKAGCTAAVSISERAQAIGNLVES